MTGGRTFEGVGVLEVADLDGLEEQLGRLDVLLQVPLQQRPIVPAVQSQ